MVTRRKGTTQLEDLLCNHSPKALPCITLIFRGKGVNVAWIYVNCPWCTHDLSQFGLELGPLVLEAITYWYYRLAFRSLFLNLGG